MFHVILDTSILRKDPQRKSVEMKRLEELIGDGHVTLHIPDIVKLEFVTGIAGQYRKILGKAHDELRMIRADFTDDIATNLTGQLLALKGSVEDRWSVDVERWLRKTNATIHLAGCVDTNAVTEWYFAGTPPFRSQKNRNDFPDAFIWATAKVVASQVGKLHMVAEDRAFAMAAQSEKRILVFKSLSDFLASTCDELASKTDDRLLSLLLEDRAMLEDQIKQLLPDSLYGLTVQGQDIPEDNNEGRIASAYEATGVDIDERKAKNLGGGFFSFPFTASVDVQLDYAVFKGDWAALSDDRIERMSISELNDHYFDAEEDGQVEVRGELDIEIVYEEPDEDGFLTNAKLADAIQDALFSMEPPDVTSVAIGETEGEEGERQ